MPLIENVFLQMMPIAQFHEIKNYLHVHVVLSFIIIRSLQTSPKVEHTGELLTLH